MNVLAVSGVRLQVVPYEGGEVLVGYDVLQRGDVDPPGPLEHVLVRPLGVLRLDPTGQDVVPPVEENAEGEESRVLVGPAPRGKTRLVYQDYFESCA